jgi:hypothetical protein
MSDAAIAMSNDGEGPPGSMENERLAKLEGAVEGFRATQSVLLGAIGLVLTVVIGFGIYSLNRLDALNARVNDLPGKISSDLRDLTGVLSQAITAARQTPPQVIILPAPQIQPSPPEKRTDLQEPQTGDGVSGGTKAGGVLRGPAMGLNKN